MSVDACNLHSSSLFLQKVGPREEKKRSSFSKLQSVGLSLVASVSKRKTSSSKDPSFNKYASTTSLPNHHHNKPPARLKPSVSARPFSQFFFPVSKGDIGIPEQQIRSLERKKTPPNNNNNNHNHSVSLDLIDDSSNYSTSRSSSLKTIKTQFVSDNVVIATANSSSDIISNSSPADIILPTNNNNKRLSGVARARTVLRLDSMKSREIRAIHVWKEAIAQLTTNDDEQDELYTILSHPALIVTILCAYYHKLLQVLNYLFLFIFSRSNL